MKTLKDFKHQVNSCSKCGICQGQCPIYKITGNDCSVSRGHFIMLQGLIKGDLKMSKTINRYLDLCLKCGKCSSFCPSGIDVVDVIVSAKSEYFNLHPFEKIISWFQKKVIFGLIPKIFNPFSKKIKSKSFDKKVVYFGGCGSKFSGNHSVVKILNALNIEVLTPDFNCCGISVFTRGDLKSFNESIESFVQILKKYDTKEVITTCASCEKSLKDYTKWVENPQTKEFLKDVKIKNIYEYIKEHQLKLKLRNLERVTFHKPCNINNFEDIEWLLHNTENLEYKPLEDLDNCCGLNGITKFSEYKIMSKIFATKRNSIKNSGAKIVLTSCLGCETALKLYSFNSYKVFDLISFIANRLDEI